MTAISQLHYLRHELASTVNHRWWRWLTVWVGGVGVIISYRIDRFLFLAIGRSYAIIRPFFFPLFLLLRLLSAGHQIHYRAEIGRGLRVLHPVLGVVVSAETIAGINLCLTGGNCIGRGSQNGRVIIGDNVYLGVNAVVIGPLKIGHRCIIGAGAVVIRDAMDDATLVGVPAKPTR